MRKSFILLSPAFVLGISAILFGWMAEDSYIYLRIADNILNGYGPVWNIDQRVQAYTGPTWLLLLTTLSSILPTPEIASIALYFILAIVLGLIIGKTSKDHSLQAAGLLFTILLLSSKSFRDWSFSGLENPLLYVLLFILVHRVQYTERRLFEAPFFLSLFYLTRPDSVIFVIALYAPFFQTMKQKSVLDFVKIVLPGFSILFCWEIFSLFYYGAILPNTAFSKMPHLYPKLDLAQKGFSIIYESIMRDPILLFLPIFASFVSFSAGLRELAYGLIFSCILFVAGSLFEGGDYMLGRLPSGIFVLSVAILLASMKSLPYEKMTRTFYILIGASCINVVFSTFLLSNSLGIYPSGNADEKVFYRETNTLSSIFNGRVHKWRENGRKLKEISETQNSRVILKAGAIGMLGYEAGPRAFIIDTIGLSDPFLSRLPACKAWRAGHFERSIPTGYLSSYIEGGPLQNDVSELEKLRVDVINATMLPLFDERRPSAIFRLLFKRYDYDLIIKELDSNNGVENEQGKTATGRCSFLDSPPPASQVFFPKAINPF